MSPHARGVLVGMRVRCARGSGSPVRPDAIAPVWVWVPGRLRVPKQAQIASQPVRGHRNRPLGCFVHKPNGRDGARKQRFGLAVRCALLAQQFVHGLLID